MKKLAYLIGLLIFGIFLTACANESEKEVKVDESEEITPEVSDEALIAVVEANAESIMAQDEAKYKDTIHSEQMSVRLLSE